MYNINYQYLVKIWIKKQKSFFLASKKTIKVPKGCTVGERISVAGKGFLNLRSKVSGNWIIIAKCHIPKKLSKKAEQLLKDYSEEIGTNTHSDGSIAGFFKKFLG